MTDFDRRTVLVGGGLLAASQLLIGRAQAARLPSTLSGQDRFNEIDRAMLGALNAGSVTGVVAVGATPDGLVYEGAFGKANTVTGAAMTPDTVFWLLSMTKAFTATACMQLVEQGRLHPDDDASKYLPELAKPQVLDGFDADGKPRLRAARGAIKVRHLLTHTSGYTYSIWSGRLTQYEKVTGMTDIATCQNGAFAAPLEFDPGERWQYGISMDWIGKLIEAITDQSLEVYFRENIFAPLGMRDSGFLISSVQKCRVASLHTRRANGSLEPAPFEMPQRPEFFSGGGGAFSTPRDYIMFLQMLLHGGLFHGTRLLKPETVATMMQNQIGELNVREMASAQPVYSRSFDQFPGQPHKWGYSFDINTRPGPNGRAPGSISWAGLLNCYFWLDPHKAVTGAFLRKYCPFTTIVLSLSMATLNTACMPVLAKPDPISNTLWRMTMYAITGTTGKVGGELARCLLAAGAPVRAVVRDAAKGEAWSKRGCEVALATMEDAAQLTAAFTGVDGVFILPPSDFDPEPGYPEARRVIDAVTAALLAAKPHKVLCLSTVGADAPHDNLLTQRTLMEQALTALDLPVTFLRAGWFMDNALWDVPAARDEGVLRSFLQPADKLFPMVATKDIGALAAELIQQSWTGSKVVELEGPVRISPNDLANAFADVLGRPIRVETVPRTTWEALFLSQGMKRPLARMRMLDGFNEGWIDFCNEARVTEKGKTPLSDVIKALIAAVGGGGAP